MLVLWAATCSDQVTQCHFKTNPFTIFLRQINNVKVFFCFLALGVNSQLYLHLLTSWYFCLNFIEQKYQKLFNK